VPPTTILLNHFDGVDAATTTTDEIVTVLWTLNPGGFPLDAQLDTSTAQFGSASLFFPSPTSGSFIAAPVPYVAGDDFTFEFFFYAAGGSIGIMRIQGGPFFDSVVTLSFDMQSLPGNLAMDVSDAGGSPFVNLSVIGAAGQNVWYHIAAVKQGTAYSLYFNGNRVGFDTDATTPGPGVRANGYEANGQDLHIDEMRFSTGARYSGATYTIPAAPFVVD
jgi:hypothetical protein